jgi:uncharacterized membrane protein YjfL (UPF0719 family)
MLSNALLDLPPHLVADLVSVAGFCIVAMIVAVIGYKFFDILLRRVDFEAELAKGNYAVAIVSASIILGSLGLAAVVVCKILG